MTGEKIISRERDQKSPTYGYGHMTKLFLESEFQQKGNKQTKKNSYSQQKHAVFSAATDSENKII